MTKQDKFKPGVLVRLNSVSFFSLASERGIGIVLKNTNAGRWDPFRSWTVHWFNNSAHDQDYEEQYLVLVEDQ